VWLDDRLRGRHQGSEDHWEAMRALSSRPLCSCEGRQVSLGDLSAAYRDTTRTIVYVETRGERILRPARLWCFWPYSAPFCAPNQVISSIAWSPSTKRVTVSFTLSPLVDLWYTLGRLITLFSGEDLHHATDE
jgi:hypothetical protein